MPARGCTPALQVTNSRSLHATTAQRVIGLWPLPLAYVDLAMRPTRSIRTRVLVLCCDSGRSLMVY